MATYSELRALFNHNELRNNIEVACIVAAETIRGEEPPDANRRLWANATMDNPRSTSQKMLMAVLAANKDLDVGDAQTANTILGATDAQIQAKVDAAVDLFADGS